MSPDFSDNAPASGSVIGLTTLCGGNVSCFWYLTIDLAKQNCSASHGLASQNWTDDQTGAICHAPKANTVRAALSSKSKLRVPKASSYAVDHMSQVSSIFARCSSIWKAIVCISQGIPLQTLALSSRHKSVLKLNICPPRSALIACCLLWFIRCPKNLRHSQKSR